MSIKAILTRGKHFLFRHKILAIFVIVVLAVLVFFFWPKSAVVIETKKPTVGTIKQTVTTTGNIQSKAAVDLKFAIAGKLTYLGAKEGDFVKQYQTIAALDQRTVQKNLEDKLKDFSLERNSFDQTKTDRGINKPEEALNDTIKRIFQDSQYNLDKAIIAVELQSLAKEQSVLTSPIDGIVTKADAKFPGINVTTTTTFSIADPYHLVFRMEVDEADIGKIRGGQVAEVILDAFPDKTLRLPISYIEFASHATTTGRNAFYVEAPLPDNTDLMYKIGMTGDAEIVIKQKQATTIVPISALYEDSYVFVKRGEAFEKRKIKLGLQNDTEAEITKGLEQEDEVALQPADAEKLAK